MVYIDLTVVELDLLYWFLFEVPCYFLLCIWGGYADPQAMHDSRVVKYTQNYILRTILKKYNIQ